MSIEICIPAYNEERVILETICAVQQAFKAAGRDARITVADNASTDKTASIARSVSGVSVLSIPMRGKGAAVIAAARQSSADVFGFIDADLSADPKELFTLLSLVESGECDIAIGSRFVDVSKVNRGIFRTVTSRIFNLIRKFVLAIPVEDTQCGLKLMNARGRAELAQCRETGWFFDMELLFRAERAGLAIREVPVNWNECHFADRASKLRLLRDGFGAIAAMIRIRRSTMVK